MLACAEYVLIMNCCKSVTFGVMTLDKDVDAYSNHDVKDVLVLRVIIAFVKLR